MSIDFIFAQRLAGMMKKCLNFAVYSLLAGGLAAFLLLPVLAALSMTASGDIMGDDAERLTVEQALTAYTRTAAEAAGDAADKGTLTAGKLADMVVLADDPMSVDPTTIKDIPVVATLAGGEFTHTTL